MTTIAALWLPILLSAVIVFIASAIIHMGPLWHRNDFPALPDQDRVIDALRPFRLQPGEYMLPRANGMKECKEPQFVEKLERGPVLTMTVIPNGPVTMSKSLVLWFIYTLVVGTLAAYIAGATAFVAYAVGLWQQSIWYHRPWSSTAKLTFDGLIYALLTGGTFGWLWPAA